MAMFCRLMGLHGLIRHARFSAHTAERIAFRRHLDKVANAIQEIERTESGDQASANEEALAIQACLMSPNDPANALLAEYRRTMLAVLDAFDCHENRDVDRQPNASAALRSVYRVLMKVWPEDQRNELMPLPFDQLSNQSSPSA